MKKVLLDTSVIIDFLRRKDRKHLILPQLIRDGYEPTCSIITLAELYSGKRIWEDKDSKNTLEELVTSFEVYPLSTNITIQAGQLRAYHTHDLVDALIAATALEENIPLATLNIKHFAKIPRLKLLTK